MTSTYSLEQPYSVLTLPRPIDSDAGRVLGGTCYSVNESRKRKRTEVVVGVDGESLSVYDVKSSSLTTSHALPPQAYLTSPPTSVHCKASGARPAYRFTYAAVRKSLVTASSEILLFREELKSGSSAGDSTAIKVVKEFGSPENPVVYLKPICSELQTGCPDIIAVQASGQITCFSSMLDEKLWSAEPSDTSNIGGEVEYISVQEASAAKQGFLKERPDVLAILEPSSVSVSQVKDTTTVLFIVSRIHGKVDRIARVLSVRSRISGSNRRNFVQPLLTLHLPTPASLSSTNNSVQYSLGKKSGLLQQLCGGSLHVYDLSGVTPQLLSTIHQPEEAIVNFLPLSSGTTMTSSKSHCGIWDVRYQSIQALQVSAVSSEPMNRLKRKQASTDSLDKPLVLLEYFSSIDTVIATCGSQLVNVQVRSSAPVKRRRLDKVRLVDCLGKGIPALSNPVASVRKPSSEYVAWEASVQKLSDAASRFNGREFDSLFIAAMGVKPNVPTPHQSGKGLRGEELQEVVLYILGKIFAWGTASNAKAAPLRASSMRMAFKPKKVLAWLEAENHLSPSNIEAALRRGAPLSKAQAVVTPRDLIIAYANFDTTLELLCKLLPSTRLDLDGAAEVAKILLQSFDTPPRIADDRLLTNGTNPATETEVQAEEEAAEKDLTIAVSLLNDETDIRGNALQYVLEHLARCYAPSELVRSLRLRLSRRDMTLLIDLLRAALSEGGWTSRYLDFFPTDAEDQSASQDEALASICILLNCALDAIGTGGWFGKFSSTSRANGDGDEEDEDEEEEGEDDDTLLTQLRLETSAVLEGVQESTFFAGFLKDFVRYEKLARENSSAAKKPRDSKVMITTTSTTSMAGANAGTGAAMHESGSVLPLGVKAADKISTTKVGAGGEIKRRSQRDIGQSISERIGKYTFETIRV